MQKLFVDYLDFLQRRHDDIKRTIEGLPQAALDWVPGSDMNSFCVIAVHLAGSERFWIGDVVAREPSDRDRESEFRAQEVDFAELAERLDDSLAYVRQVLEGLKLEDLGTTCVSPQDGREFTTGWVLLHVLEHAAVHLGHVQLTRQLWEQRPKE